MMRLSQPHAIIVATSMNHLIGCTLSNKQKQIPTYNKHFFFFFHYLVDYGLVDQGRELQIASELSLAPAVVWIQGCLKCLYSIIGQAVMWDDSPAGTWQEHKCKHLTPSRL